jgi:activator of 2-hydroxyglutaryl-CoA dehydratase
MSCFLGVDIGSVNAKLALVDEKGGVVEFDTEKVSSSPRAAVSSLIARLGKRFNLEEIVAAGVSGSGRAVIPKELGWTEYSSSLAIASGLLHHSSDVEAIIQNEGLRQYGVEMLGCSTKGIKL